MVGVPSSPSPVGDPPQAQPEAWHELDVPGRQPAECHALEIREIEELFGTGPDGLSDDAAARRLARHGPNELEESPPPRLLTTLLHQFRSPLISILLVAGVVTVALGEHVDAIVIGLALGLNAIIGTVQEWRAAWSVRALLDLMTPRARVIRDGVQREIPGPDLVPGDVVLLSSGVRVPADLRLATATALRIDESVLTGESVPVDKHTRPIGGETVTADRTNMAYTGTVVTGGRGRGYVTATGAHTELGAIAHDVKAAPEPRTPLTIRMTRLARVISVAAVASAAAVFVIGLLGGRSATEMFLVGVAMAVSAVPEGLPVALTVALALGVRRMSRRNAIVQSLPAVETLGSATTIGSDKTGTLTRNRMTTRSVWTPDRWWHLEDAAQQPSRPEAAREDHPLHLTLAAGVLASEAEVYLIDGARRTEGDPTEVALLLSAVALGLEPAALRARYGPVATLPFEPERRFAASLRRRGGQRFLFVAGAPERVLGMSTGMLTEDGLAPLDPEVVHRAADAMARDGLRVLAMAYNPVGPDVEEVPGAPSDLVFLGLQGMWDPPREGVEEAVAGCREAGIRVVMITGDHAVTARAIARVLGIGGQGHDDVLTGSAIEQLAPEELRDRARRSSVFARVSPDQKLRIVEALRDAGEVVAVTGDGVNDAPALKAADLGIAMGASGTDVAREAADIVLADDNFVSIHAAVEEGRATFDNVRKVAYFLLACGLAEILAILTALILGWPLLLLPAQILWLNIVTNGVQDVALAFEPAERGLLQQPPRAVGEGILSRALWERTLIVGMIMAAVTLGMFHWAWELTGSVRTAQSVALTTLVLAQAAQLVSARAERRSAFRVNPFSNPFLLVAQVAALIIHATALSFGPTQTLLRVEPLDLDVWLLAAVAVMPVLLVSELHKRLRTRPPVRGVHADVDTRASRKSTAAPRVDSSR